MIKEITIRNYKSIHDLTMELGHVNVLIGENGCGKTNILEAVAMLNPVQKEISFEDMEAKGIRVCAPNQMRSAFVAGAKAKSIEIGIRFEGNDLMGTWVMVPLSSKAGNLDWKFKKDGFDELLSPTKDAISRLKKSAESTNSTLLSFKLTDSCTLKYLTVNGL